MPMCAAFSAPFPACSRVARAAPLFGERKESSPQRRAHPRIALSACVVVSTGFGLRASVPRISWPSDSATRTTPLLVCILVFAVSLPLLDFVTPINGGARP